ncbi:uncharacterized protein Dmoj_GI11721 [Drosophila mojavensis]|uniref:Protein krueppel n=1 Tax=Drosophila mojavensis TaxID=7230 RepID=B4L051_DROMO|nr:uncharacterized protein Dmoj_GI11721 [Drosophila mojavensis]
MKMEICRACMSESHTLVDIFCDRPLADYEYSVAEMLNELVDFKIARDDKLPQKICVSCGLNAQIAFRFKRRLQQSHQLLCMKVSMEYPEEVTVLDTDSDDEVKDNEAESKWNLEKRQPYKRKMTSCERLIMENIFNDCDRPDSTTLDIADADSGTTHRYPLRRSTRMLNLSYCENVSSPTALRSNLRMFKCERCVISFTTIDNFLKHQKSHVGKRIYKCLHCPKVYRKQSRLQKHIKSHSNEHRYMCGQCSRAFKYKSDLDEHTLAHSEERPFVCPYCQFTFKKYFHLCRHVRNHMSPRSFQCEACNKTFTTKWNLKCHINTPNRCPAIRGGHYNANLNNQNKSI